MSSTLVSALHNEERSIIAELRASKPFQRLEGIHKLLSLYDAQPLVSVSLGAGGSEPERNAAPVIQLAPPPAAPIPMPGPSGTEHVAAGGAVAMGQGGVAMEETSGVVSSVRAALLGIGKG